jgi:hypothetical protein
MVRMNICGLLWLSGWKGWGTKCVVHHVGENFARRRETRQPPSVARMVAVMRERITATQEHKAPLGEELPQLPLLRQPDRSFSHRRGEERRLTR